EERLARQELVPKCFAVPCPPPQFLAAPDPTHSTLEQSREDHADRRVEPDHGVGARPHQIARAATRVVPVDDPGVAFDRARDPLLEAILRPERPAPSSPQLL